MTRLRDPVRVLFVDDEAHVLKGLERVLHRQNKGWSMVFATGGEEALSRLAEGPTDVIVSDMQMPGIDGAALMQEVRRRHPEVVRLILTGHSDPGMILRAVRTTHQFLVKPCLPEELIETVERTLEPRRRLGRDDECRRIGRIERLPSPSGRMEQLRAALDRPSISSDELGQIMGADPAMTVRVVQLSNSVYGHGRTLVTDPADAVARVGVDRLRSLGEMPIFCEGVPDSPELEAWARHSLMTARCARGIAERAELDRSTTGLVYLAGLLHDLGDLMGADGLPAGGTQDGRGGLGVLAGDYFLALWGFPKELRGVIRGIHEPVTDSRENATLSAVQGGHELAGQMPQACGEGLYLPLNQRLEITGAFAGSSIGNEWVRRCQELWTRGMRSSEGEEYTNERNA
jgi:HD-like signal output (HDOD) protein/CheY-like chemotaxis protein